MACVKPLREVGLLTRTYIITIGLHYSVLLDVFCEILLFLDNPINTGGSNELSVQHQDNEIDEPYVQYENSGHSVDHRSSNESSAHRPDYEIQGESNVHLEHSKPPTPRQSTSNEEGTVNNSEENVVCEDYSSLHRDSFSAIVQPSLYTKLHLYANMSSEETKHCFIEMATE